MSAQCSRSCDTGLQHRQIKCLDVDQRSSQSCDEQRRPEPRRTCNHLACPAPSDQQQDSYSGAGGGGGGLDRDEQLAQSAPHGTENERTNTRLTALIPGLPG